MKLQSGAYDTLITQSVEEVLVATDLIGTINEVDAAEAAEQYSRLIAAVVRRAISALPDKDRVIVGADMVNRLINHLDTRWSKLQASQDTVATNPMPQVLYSLLAATPTGEVVVAPHPKTPQAHTALLTNAPGEGGEVFTF